MSERNALVASGKDMNSNALVASGKGINSNALVASGKDMNIPISKSYTILKDGKVDKERLLDALELLKSDLDFLISEIKKEEMK